MRNSLALICTLASLAISLPLNAQDLKAQDLPFARQYFSAAPSALANIAQVSPTPVAGGKGSVLVIFRLGAAGRVLDAQATGATQEMQQSALSSVRQWKGRGANFNGSPSQLVIAAVLEFSKGAIKVSSPSTMMSANQMSPRLNFACPNAIQHHDAKAVDSCREQLDEVTKSPAATDIERITAHDEYGLALLNAHDAKAALPEFSQAVGLGEKSFQPSDPEWSYLYLHRAVAEEQNGDISSAQQDRAKAKESLDGIISTSTGLNQTYYRGVEQHFLSSGS